MSPLAIADVQYLDDAAVAACVVATHWTDAAPVEERTTRLTRVKAYEPGRFYLRELPCLIAVLEAVETAFDVVVIDGYVDLDEGRPGLGAHLRERLGSRVAVVGVAKSAYRGSRFAIPVVRGGSARPLFVTARGIPAERAAELVRAMHGSHRIPTLLAHADRLARSRGHAHET